MRKIIIIIVILNFFYGCKSSGIYHWNGNTETDKNYLSLNEDRTFIYTWSNHIAGKHTIYGTWKSIGDKFYLKENDLKFKNNELINLGKKKNNYIKLTYLNGDPMPFTKVKINNINYETDFDGYCYYADDTIRSIVIYDTGTNYLLGKFDIMTTEISSYILKIDYMKIGKSFCNDCPFYLLKKGRKLYPLKDSEDIDKNYYFIKN